MAKQVKINNPFNINANIVISNDGILSNAPTTSGIYGATSLSPSNFTPNAIYFLENLSHIDDIIVLDTPLVIGNTIFNTSTPITVCLYGDTNPTIFSNKTIPYIDKGKSYEGYSSIAEIRNFDNLPVSNENMYTTIGRSDINSFDLPQISPRGMRKIPLTSGDTVCCSSGYTYDRINYNWLFGNNAGITFNPIQSGATPTPLSGAMISQEGCATISNSDGNLLFYTNGETVYTSGHTVMSNGTGLSSSGTSTQSCIIVPKPESNIYYIFTTDFNGNPDGFEYSIVDMSLQGGSGQVGAKNIKLINNPISEKVTACNHSNCDDFWVITHTSGDSTYYTYKLSSGGISVGPVTNIGSIHNTARGYMKTSIDGKKLISLLYDEDTIDILDFESSAGTLSNLITITGYTFDVGPYGLEFSSDSSKFYVSDGAGENITQFDLSYTSATDMVSYAIEVASVSGGRLGALQMGPDEKIYVADKSTYLSCLDGFTLVGENCVSTTASTTVSAETIVKAVTNFNYNKLGARFCVSNSYTTCGSGAPASNFFNTGNSDPFWGTNLGIDGRLNEIGVWVNEPPAIEDEWIGFSNCVTAPTDGQYLIALAGDNGIRFSLDGVQLVENPWDGTITANNNFNYWWVWPLDLTAGEHVINLEGYDDGGDAAFGCEIIGPYPSGTFTTNTDFNIFTGTTGKDSYTANTIFSSLDEIGNTFDTQSNTCPSGYTYDVCADQCIKVESSATISEKPYLHVIHRPDGLGVQCNFQENGFNLSSSTVTGTSSTWGLPNIITTKSLSCDRYMYISDRDRPSFEFDFVFNDVSNVIQPKKLDYLGKLYAYNQETKEFGTSILNVNILHNDLSAGTTSNVVVPINILDEGEYIVKNYFNYPVLTLISNQLDINRSTFPNFQRGSEYGLYNPELDWYFLNMFKADIPNINNNDIDTGSINNLKVVSIVTDGITSRYYGFNTNSDYIVALNGGVLAKDIQYSASTGSTQYLQLSFTPLIDQIITIAYVENGANGDIYTDFYEIISPIPSGPTNGQSNSDKVYFNTTTNRSEFYMDTAPNSIPILVLNGNVLSYGIDYLLSSSDNKRIIVLGNGVNPSFVVGDIIEVFYSPTSIVFGTIGGGVSTITWSINNSPKVGYGGEFTIEFTNFSDINYDTILYSTKVSHIIDQRSYAKSVELTGVSVGTKIRYRIKNKKTYKSISGKILSDESVSESYLAQVNVAFDEMY